MLDKYWKGSSGYATVGIEFVLSVLLGLAVGRWLDGKLASAPWLTLTGLALGATAGFRALWREIDRANREADRLEAEAKEARRKFHGDDDG